MSIGENIRQIREGAGLTQAQLAQIAGVTGKAVSMWEIGLRAPRMGAIQKLADYFGITKSEIIDGITPVETGNFSNIPVFENADILLKTAPSAAPVGYEPVPQRLLQEMQRYCYLVIQGEEMSPILEAGDLALIHVGGPVYSGEYAAVYTAENQTVSIKKVGLEKNSLQLICENPYYPKKVLPAPWAQQATLLGPVCRIVRNFKD